MCLFKGQKVQSVVNLADKEGKTSLMEAAKMGHLDCLKALIEFGCTVNKRCREGFTALMYASEGGHLSCVQFLLNNGARTDVAVPPGLQAHSCAPGCSSLMLAADEGHSDCLEALLAAEADVNHADESGRTALMLGSKCENSVQLLLLHGASVNATDKWSSTALHWAVNKSRNNKSVLLLLQKGSSVNHKDSWGSTPLIKVNCKFSQNTKCKCNFASRRRKNPSNFEWATLCFTTSQQKRSTLVQLLQEWLWASPRFFCRFQNTFLFHFQASTRHFEDNILLLLSFNADLTPTVRNRSCTALDVLLECMPRPPRSPENEVYQECKRCAWLLLAAGDSNVCVCVCVCLCVYERECVCVCVLLSENYFWPASLTHPDLQGNLPDSVSFKSFVLILHLVGFETETPIEGLEHCHFGKGKQYTLRNLCRFFIRRHMLQENPHSNLVYLIPQLSLPSLIKSYLSFDFRNRDGSNWMYM